MGERTEEMSAEDIKRANRLQREIDKNKDNVDAQLEAIRSAVKDTETNTKPPEAEFDWFNVSN